MEQTELIQDNLIHSDNVEFEEISSVPNTTSEEARVFISTLLPDTLPKEDGNGIVNSYDIFVAKLRQLTSEVLPFTKPSMNPEDWKNAKINRIRIVKVRTSAERLKDSLKKDLLLKGKAIQDVYNHIEKEAKKVEAQLKEVEETGERLEEERLDKLEQERKDILTGLSFDYTFINLRTMDEVVFQQLVKTQEERKKKEETDAANAKALEEMYKTLGQTRTVLIAAIDKDAADAYATLESQVELGQLSPDEFKALSDDITQQREKKIEDEKQAKIYQEKLSRMRIRAAQLQGLKVNPDLYDLMNMEDSVFESLAEDLKSKAEAAENTAKLENLRNSRRSALLRFTDVVPINTDLALLDDHVFAEMLAKAESDYNAKLKEVLDAELAAKAPDKTKFINECLRLSFITNPPEFKSKYYKQLYFDYQKEVMAVIKKYEEKIK